MTKYYEFHVVPSSGARSPGGLPCTMLIRRMLTGEDDAPVDVAVAAVVEVGVDIYARPKPKPRIFPAGCRSSSRCRVPCLTFWTAFEWAAALKPAPRS